MPANENTSALDADEKYPDGPGKFAVTYSLRYEHVVTVGVTADSYEDAENKAQAMFDAGTYWDDTPENPLLYDDYDESDDNTLFFEPRRVEGDQFPAPGGSVLALRKEAALRELADVLAKSLSKRGDLFAVVRGDGALRKAIYGLGTLDDSFTALSAALEE